MNMARGANRNAVLTLFLAIMMAAGSATGQQTRQSLTKSKKQLEEEIEYTNSLLQQTQKTKESSLNKLQLLNRQIGKREELIHTINTEIGTVDEQIAAGNKAIGNLSSDLKSLKEDYARMIYYAYRTMRTTNRLVFIFSASDFNQAYLRLRYYRQYAESRRRQAEKIRSTQETLNRKQNELQNVRDQKMALMAAQEKTKMKLTQEQQEKDKTVKELSRKEKELMATLKTKQTALNKLQAEIEKLITSERAAAKKVSGSKTSTDMSLTPAEKELSGTFAASRGALPWPSEKGIVISTFGEHPHPVLKYVKVKNNGIDISVSNGTPIRSVFEGKVSRVLTVPNLNKVVIIRHGEYLSVYSNLDAVSVSEGQEVKTKQVIGTIHSDPEDGKSELHFEIWLGKTIQDPQAWLSH